MTEKYKPQSIWDVYEWIMYKRIEEAYSVKNIQQAIDLINKYAISCRGGYILKDIAFRRLA